MKEPRRFHKKPPLKAATLASDTGKEEASGLKARVLATALLKAVFLDRQPFDDTFSILSAKRHFADLPVRDRAFSRAIAMVGLRRFGQIEALLKVFLEKPLPPDAWDARLILVTAAAQLIFLEVAPHAAIGLAVEQAKQSREAARFSGLINAVLRRVSKEGAAVVAAQDAGRLNTPAWLYERWLHNYGSDTVSKIVEAHAQEPALDLSVKADAADWALKLGGHVTRFGGVRLGHKGRIEDIEGYEEGAWWVQDAAASLPVQLLGAVTGERVADVCAAPGGKTAQLAARGGHVTAIDLSASRLRRLNENMRRLCLDVSVVQANAGSWQPDEPFDAVLLDAPCSATGTIRRNPDIAYLKTEEDVQVLAEVQARLFAHMATFVKPGGRLMYCTCSLEPEEGEQQIDRFLKGRPEFTVAPFEKHEMGEMKEAITQDGFLRTLPFFDAFPDGGETNQRLPGMDGFFAARLLRAS